MTVKKHQNQPRRNAESIGISTGVVFAWALSEFSGVQVPAEVTAAISGLIAVIAARIKDD